jgi:two-component system alkaline phosphatase synthesis response regulator PhoP
MMVNYLSGEAEKELVVPDAKILVVDDEQDILDLVVAYLEAEGYDVRTAQDGLIGLDLARQFAPDLIVLDIMLPGLDGMQVLTRLRRESEVYVIMLTAKAEETDKIVGLSVGADDYLTKPFSPRELVARIKAALRRIQGEAGPAGDLAFAHVRVDPDGRRAWADGQEIDLTTIEFDLLLALAQNAGRVLSREQLLQKVWGYDYYGDDRVVDVHIGHVRQKLGEHSQAIVTVRGVGYRFEDEG